jgi:hypothetical protein
VYSSPDITRTNKSRKMSLEEYVARTEEMRNAFNIFVGNPERKTPLRRPRRRWEDNIQMDLKEKGGGCCID